ncbi:hypothetical protein OG912_00060 [Streptomyces sp. NBC_00464]|uniref:hypothetical protein n=1 Tax=Streptomyces sp. NBC_00464 TaxID=2975751 RepID=UPI002E19A1FA
MSTPRISSEAASPSSRDTCAHTGSTAGLEQVGAHGRVPGGQVGVGERRGDLCRQPGRDQVEPA